MKRRPILRALCCMALTATALSFGHTVLAADPVKIGFLVKQAEEP